MGNVNWGSGGVPTYGNYGGPGWTAGKWGGIDNGTVAPVDDFDSAFQAHDKAYLSGHLGLRAVADKVLLDTLDALKGTVTYSKLSPLDKAYIDLGVPTVFETLVPADRKVFFFKLHVEKFMEWAAATNFGHRPCFPAGTPIALPDGSTAAIETLTPQDNIASFAEHGERLRDGTCLSPLTSPLRKGTVRRLYHNLTDEWVTLAITDPGGGEVSYLTSTPGHVMLTPAGGYRRLCDMIDGAVVPLKSEAIKQVKGAEHYKPLGMVKLVLKDGRIAKAEAHSIKYSAATARLFEQTEMLVTLTEHGLALKPEMHKGWKTYNFEVEKYHTYVAGGVRVHNTSANSLGFVDNGFDVSGIFGAGVAATSAIWDGRATAALANTDNNPYTPSLSSPGIVVSADADTGWVSVSNSITGVTTVTTPDGMQAIDYSNSPGLTGPGPGGGGGAPGGGYGGTTYGGYDDANSGPGGDYNGPGGSADSGKPILIDLDGDGVELLPQDENFVLFDFDDDGFDERTAWVGADDGFLMFDENGDGVLNALDADWNQFGIWRDANSDGVLDEGEFQSLATWGITSIALSYSDNSSTVILADGTVINGFIDVTQIDDTGATSTILGADVGLAYATGGVKETTVAGVTTYEYEAGNTRRAANDNRPVTRLAA